MEEKEERQKEEAAAREKKEREKEGGTESRRDNQSRGRIIGSIIRQDHLLGAFFSSHI